MDLINQYIFNKDLKYQKNIELKRSFLNGETQKNKQKDNNYDIQDSMRNFKGTGGQMQKYLDKGQNIKFQNSIHHTYHNYKANIQQKRINSARSASSARQRPQSVDSYKENDKEYQNIITVNDKQVEKDKQKQLQLVNMQQAIEQIHKMKQTKINDELKQKRSTLPTRYQKLQQNQFYKNSTQDRKIRSQTIDIRRNYQNQIFQNEKSQIKMFQEEDEQEDNENVDQILQTISLTKRSQNRQTNFQQEQTQESMDKLLILEQKINHDIYSKCKNIKNLFRDIQQTEDSQIDISQEQTQFKQYQGKPHISNQQNKFQTDFQVNGEQSSQIQDDQSEFQKYQQNQIDSLKIQDIINENFNSPSKTKDFNQIDGCLSEEPNFKRSYSAMKCQPDNSSQFNLTSADKIKELKQRVMQNQRHLTVLKNANLIQNKEISKYYVNKPSKKYNQQDLDITGNKMILNEMDAKTIIDQKNFKLKMKDDDILKTKAYKLSDAKTESIVRNNYYNNLLAQKSQKKNGNSRTASYGKLRIYKGSALKGQMDFQLDAALVVGDQEYTQYF